MVRSKNTNPARRAPRRNMQGHVETGSQELAQITLGTPSGTFVGGQIPLIPTFEPGSRLSLLAVQYSQYAMVSSVVKFHTQTTTNTSGRLVMAWTFDPLESTPVSCHQLLQIAGAKTTPLWRDISTRMTRRSPDKRRFPVIEGPQFTALDTVDKLMYLPATLVFGTDGSAQSGLIVGSLVWHYKITFFNPNFVIGASLRSYETIAPPTIINEVPLFTRVEPKQSSMQVRLLSSAGDAKIDEDSQPDQCTK